MKDPLKPRDKITQKMTRDGAITENQTTGETERISKRTQDAELQKTPEQQAAQDAAQLQGAASPTSPLPHVPGAAPKADTGKTERVMEHIEAAHTRKASKKAVRKAQAEATAGTKSSRLQFTDEERAAPELEKYIKKSDKAADRLDKAKAAIPKEKKLVKERTFDEATGKGKTRLHFEEQDKPPGFKEKHSPLSRPAQEAGILVHNKIHSVEKDNSGVEGAHKSEETAERGLKYGARKIKQGYRSHKLKPYREAAKAEKAAFKANVDFQYHKTLHDNPQLTSNPISRFWQKQKIKRQYAKEARNTAKGIKGAAERTRKAAAKAAEKTKQTAAFVARHPAGVAIAVGVLLLFIMVMSGLSSCGAMFSGTLNGVLGTSYTSEDSDLVEVENSYAGLENELQSRIDNIERDNPGYDEYRYDLENIGHNPHELASYLTAKYQSYTRADVQSELQRIFNQQYKLTLTEEVEIRYREEERTDTWTDEDGKGKQFKILKDLMHRADVSEVVNACDAGREGELIFRFVYHQAGCKKPFTRLWISSMENEAIRSGFDNLKDGREYDALYHSALCRAKADWLIGINATRLFSCLYGKTLNVGRVQTPTLKMLVDRDAAIMNFKKEKYYHVCLMLSGAEAASAKIRAADEASELKAACEASAAVCTSLTREKKTVAPPKLFDLTSLQREANRIYGYTATGISKRFLLNGEMVGLFA